jgi:hypothetical protein
VMDQAEKFAALSQKVSSLEDQMSALMAKILQLEDGDLYMTELLKQQASNLFVSWSEPPSERSYRAPCVVLVINDNPYGLMVALSYMCRTCP